MQQVCDEALQGLAAQSQPQQVAPAALRPQQLLTLSGLVHRQRQGGEAGRHRADRGTMSHDDSGGQLELE